MTKRFYTNKQMLNISLVTEMSMWHLHFYLPHLGDGISADVFIGSRVCGTLILLFGIMVSLSNNGLYVPCIVGRIFTIVIPYTLEKYKKLH